MASFAQSRPWHLALIVAVGLALTLPGLGTPPLWDIDEGLNAEASREMLERGDWVVPRFNAALRTAKPVLINWAQMSSYSLVGVSEWSARLPSALAVILALIGVYILGRRLFDAPTGLIASLALGSCILVGLLGRAATPDALLLACVVWTFVPFVLGTIPSRDPRRTGLPPTARPESVPVSAGWYALVGAVAGLGMLAKGPVALALPAVVCAVWLVWCGRWRQLVGWRILLVPLAFFAVSAPWYVLVGLQTRGAFPYAFFVQENVGRALEPMERHGGPIWYHAVALLVGFAPWSVFIGPALWYAWRHDPADRPACRLLGVWAFVWLGCFSLAATKLPGYVLPMYPAVALLTARYLVRWWRGALQTPGWLMPLSVGLFALIGVVSVVGLRVVGDGTLAAWQDRHPFAGVERWAFVGLVPVMAAAGAALALRRDRRGSVIAWTAGGSVVFLALLGSNPPAALGEHTAPRALVAESGACVPSREVRVGAFNWFQPSTAYYVRREVRKLANPIAVADLLDGPLEAYVFVPATDWEQIRHVVRTPSRTAARHWDLYARREVIVVTNR